MPVLGAVCAGFSQNDLLQGERTNLWWVVEHMQENTKSCTLRMFKLKKED